MTSRLIAALAVLVSYALYASPVAAQSVFINEIHYDNAGTDVGEGFEIAGPAGTDLTGWSVVLYNGNGGSPYNAIALSGSLTDDGSGFGFASETLPSNGIQNGAPDGLALVNAVGTVIQFLSYEGTLTAVGGPADGITSTDIGVSESSSTPVGFSLQLSGTGTAYGDFGWTADTDSFGTVNNGQSFGGAPPPPPPPPPTVGICEIQGDGASSDYVGQDVTVLGIVTGDFQDGELPGGLPKGLNGDLNGFYMEDRGCDADPLTSNGIFVFDRFDPAVDVNIGDAVEIIGRVSEFFGETQINASGSGAQVTVVGSGSVAPTPVSLPSASTFVSSTGEPIADLERYEGMLVEFTGYFEIAEHFNLDRFGEVVLAQGGRFKQFTQAGLPDAAGYAAHLEEIGSRTLYVDDGLTVQNPDPIRYPFPALDSHNTVRAGDVATNLIGNIRFSRGSGGSGDEAYRLEPTVEPNFIASNSREAAPRRPNRSIRFVALNVLNFFTTIDESGAACFPSATRRDCRGADSQVEFDRQLQKLVTAISEMDADIVGLVELENNYADGPNSAIQVLANALNANGGSSCDRYAAVEPGADRIGDDAIAVGIIYCASTVRLAPGTSPAILDDAELQRLGNILPGFPTFEGPVFDGFATSRAPLAATFRPLRAGEKYTVVVNHFKSKGSSGLFGTCSADPSVDPNCDQGDGAAFWDERRTDAARAVAAWLGADPTGASGDRVVILGDLNAYQNEDPILELENSGYVNVLRGDPNAYSFIFDRQLGTLDYAFVDQQLAERILQISVWHINADEPDALDYNLDFGRNPALFDGLIPARMSDHDPLILDIEVRGRGYVSDN